MVPFTAAASAAASAAHIIALTCMQCHRCLQALGTGADATGWAIGGGQAESILVHANIGAGAQFGHRSHGQNQDQPPRLRFLDLSHTYTHIHTGSCSLSYMLRPVYLMELSNMEPKARSSLEEAKLAHYLSCVPSLAHLPCEIRIKLSRIMWAVRSGPRLKCAWLCDACAYVYMIKGLVLCTEEEGVMGV
eukprot:1138862-Pelagomonas_calceolata.AAC.5